MRRKCFWDDASEVNASEVKLTFRSFSIRKLKAPRKREIEALPRSFNYAYCELSLLVCGFGES